MLLFRGLLFLCLFFLVGSREIKFTSESDDPNAFDDFELSIAGRDYIMSTLKKLFKKKLFLTPDDNDLILKEDILPWKPSDVDRTELKKRRVLRKIVKYFIDSILHGIEGGSEVKEIMYTSEEAKQSSGWNQEFNSKGQHIITYIHPETLASEKGVAVGWVITAINDREVKSNPDSFSAVWDKEAQRAEMIFRFETPKYASISADSVENLSLGNFMDILGMDFVALSNIEKQKIKEEL